MRASSGHRRAKRIDARLLLAALLFAASVHGLTYAQQPNNAGPMRRTVKRPVAGDRAAKPAQTERTYTPEQLVAFLGHDSYEVRRKASLVLAKMGPPAKSALLAGLKSDDAEIRRRCRQVLGVVLELDHREQLEAFVADRDGQEECHLAGWQRFRDEVGEDRGARALFAEMHRHEAYLLEVADDAPDALAQSFVTRCEQLQRVMVDPDPLARRQASLGSVAALFFVASDPRMPLSEPIATYLHNFSYQQAFQHGMQQSTQRNDAFALRKLLGLWVGRDTGTAAGYHNFLLALRYDLDEALQPAVAALQRPAAASSVQQFALLVVGRFGDVSRLPLVESLLDSTQACGVYQDGAQQYPMELRDLALAVAIHLVGQQHADYGFATIRESRPTLFVLNSVGFRSVEEREAAIAKWHAWRNMSAQDAD